MKKLLLILILSLLKFNTNATEQVTFDILTPPSGWHLMHTLMSDDPYVTWQDKPDGSGATYFVLSGDLETVHSFTLDFPIGCVDYYLHELTSSDGYFLYYGASQHFFNDDDLYEVIIRGDDQYFIYNEIGECLAQLPVSYPQVYIDGNGVGYLFDRYYLDPQTGATKEVLLKPKKENSSANTVKFISPDELSIYPVPANYNETIDVKLPHDIDKNMTLSVYTLNGTLLFKKDCKIGENHIEIPAYRLSKGINSIIVVDENQNIIATGKAVLN